MQNMQDLPQEAVGEPQAETANTDSNVGTVSPMTAAMIMAACASLPAEVPLKSSTSEFVDPEVNAEDDTAVEEPEPQTLEEQIALQLAEAETKDLEQLHRVASGTIYHVDEQMMFDTMQQILSPSGYKKLLTDELRKRKPMNRKARRVMMSRGRKTMKLVQRRLRNRADTSAVAAGAI